jgi:hypothetical protein
MGFEVVYHPYFQGDIPGMGSVEDGWFPKSLPRLKTDPEIRDYYSGLLAESTPGLPMGFFIKDLSNPDPYENESNILVAHNTGPISYSDVRIFSEKPDLLRIENDPSQDLLLAYMVFENDPTGEERYVTELSKHSVVSGADLYDYRRSVRSKTEDYIVTDGNFNLGELYYHMLRDSDL